MIAMKDETVKLIKLTKGYKISLYIVFGIMIWGIIYTYIGINSFRGAILRGDLENIFGYKNIETKHNIATGEFFAIITLDTYSGSEQDYRNAYEKIKAFYTISSERYKMQSDVWKITLIVENKLEQRLFTSILFKDEVYKVNWRDIQTYGEFKKAAFIQITTKQP